MKTLIFLVLFSSLITHATDEVCDENDNSFYKFAAKISLPNCHKKEILNTTLCTDCLSQFEKAYNKKITETNKEVLQKTFLEASLKEFKKSITHNMVEALKMSALPDTGADFAKSTKACKLKTLQDFAQGCNSPEALKLLGESERFKSLNQEIAGELATILSTTESFSSEKTLLKRGTNACFVRERDVLQLTSAALEEEFTPELIAAIKKLDPKSIKSFDDIFFSDEVSKVFSGDFTDLINSLKLHPLLRDHFKDPKTTMSFFKSIKEPHNSSRLRESLYSRKNGENFDNNLSQNCEKSFEAFKKAICSPEFAHGNIDLKPGENFKKLTDDEFTNLDSEFASSEEAINKNLSLLKLCPNQNKTHKMSFQDESKKIAGDLDEVLKANTLVEFQDKKFQMEMGATKEQLCDLTDCEGTFICKVKKKYKEMKTGETLDAKLATTSNKSANNLLRSMIGDASSTDAKTKEILIAHGIIPQADGKLVAQPEVPERKADYFALAHSNPTEPAAAPAKGPQTSHKNLAATPRQDSGRTEYTTDQSAEELANYNLPDFKDLLGDSDEEELKKIQDEIRRRIRELPDNKPSSHVEAKKIAREAFKGAGRSITPVQENKLATRMMESASETPVARSDFHQNSPKPQDNGAQVSKADTQLTKWKKNQMNEALAGMQGARSVATKDIIDAQTEAQDKTKALTTVALNIAEDPRITLSDVFQDKLARNDSETQLLKVLVRSQKNFILNVKSVNFKVVFDEEKKLRILLESGDEKEALRLRPQLEMFLKKLNSEGTFRY
ncbi:MAG: hypothetical protein NDI69_00160 [Bacteriovoracaceae bacterium]|nr:hypothetical protein [Bacteriovoracaceae bacterium]